MFKRVSLIFCAILIVILIASCAHTSPIGATSNPVGSKVGEASSTVIIGMFSPDGGDASIATAAKNGKISKISTVDYRTEMVFLFYVMKRTTIVTGE